MATISDYTGRQYALDDLTSLAKELYARFDPSMMSGGVFGTTGENIGFDANTLKAALGVDNLTTPEQVAYDMARYLNQKGFTSLSDLEKAAAVMSIDPGMDTGSGSTTQEFFRDYVFDPAASKGAAALFDATGSNQINLGQTATGEGMTTYFLQRDPVTGEYKVGTGGYSSSDKGMLMATLGALSTAFGVPGILGEGLGLTGSAASAAGGALVGGGTAALAGENILKGAVLGGAMGYAGSELGNYIRGTDSLDAASQTALKAADAYEAVGNLTNADVGGLLTTAGDASGFIGEGITSGVPEWDLAQYSADALNAADLYARTGTLTAQDIANQLNIPLEDAADIIRNTGGYLNEESIAQLLEQYGNDALNAADSYGSPDMNVLPDGTQLDTTPFPPEIKQVIESIPPSTWAKVIAAAGGLLTTKTATDSPNAPPPTGPGGLPSQGIPTAGSGYYDAVQQYYNQYMPNAPRNVSGPLEQWYNNTYGSTPSTVSAATASAQPQAFQTNQFVPTAAYGTASYDAAPASFQLHPVLATQQPPSSGGTGMSTAFKTSDLSSLSEAQRMLYEALNNQPGMSPDRYLNRVGYLNDTQALMQLAKQQGKYDEVAAPSRVVLRKNLENLYGIPLVKYD